MPINYSRYPKNWHDVSKYVRLVRAAGQCECTGQCGLHQSGKNLRRCLERNGLKARWAKGKIVLTTAHLCTCDPICADLNHLIAACQRCHLRIDRLQHAYNRRLNALLAAGYAARVPDEQLKLLAVPPPEQQTLPGIQSPYRYNHKSPAVPYCEK